MSELEANDAAVSAIAALSSGADDWCTKSSLARPGWRVRLSDGPHGLRIQEPNAASLELRRTVPATCFPPAVALGSTWDPEIVERVGIALAVEARTHGVDVVLGPGMNIKRSPLCGRNFEYFSEDPHLTAEMALAMVRGLQSQGVGACVKHFAANNQETDRMRVDVRVDERTLREIYLAAFERVITEGDPWMVMSAYNAVNGALASENPTLLSEILRDEWGYRGVVVSDWGAVSDRVAAVAAGLDLEMPHADSTSDEELERALVETRIPWHSVERAAARVEELIARAHLHPQRSAPVDFAIAEHHEVALEAARRAIVLLKNAGRCLPLPADRPVRLALLGSLATEPRIQGAGSSHVNPTRCDTVLDALRELVAPGSAIDHVAQLDGALALRAAAGAEATIVMAGLSAVEESEGYDRHHLRLPVDQLLAIRELRQVTPRLVVVLTNGGVVETAGWEADVDAVIEGWLLGQASGRALAEVLVGAHNPSGRLAETIPINLRDVPSSPHFPGSLGEVHYGERFYVGYRGYDVANREVAYPFGHGLSYTTFCYSGLDIVCSGIGDGIEVEVALRISNAGSCTGAEVVQLYVAPLGAVADRPPQELRGFARVLLDPEAEREVRLRVGARAFARWDSRDRRWLVETGRYELRLGSSSRDIRLRGVVEIIGNELRRPLCPSATLGEWMSDSHGRAVLSKDPVFAQFILDWERGETTTARMVGAVPLAKVAALFGLRGAGLDLDALAAAANLRRSAGHPVTAE